jgi:hypothetical protein
VQVGVRNFGRKRRQASSPSSASTAELNEKISALTDQVGSLQDRLLRLEEAVSSLVELVRDQRTIKESYTTVEVANILGKKPYTVREWCRLQRVNASKAMCGRGCEEEWRISHEELLRIQNEGLLPIPDRY